ncbi:hypothetical protein IGI04_007879 [Brassica rapa subsp. trilocularis]|uniref:Uncharacterized protein n=1 Tax=Brassica rapa subsp. trilocularis TaxID=1813537 RepID=A0ABQ7NKZ5_BRACM|nr:hypothetical protein IGI04_007879 [Brassica rapa subsp. trilocularis]
MRSKSVQATTWILLLLFLTIGSWQSTVCRTGRWTTSEFIRILCNAFSTGGFGTIDIFNYT